MTEEETDQLSTTMRIDLPPELEAESGRAAPTVVRRKRARIVIPKASSESQLIGGVDFQELLQNVYDGAVITTLGGAIQSANLRAMQFFDYTGAEFSSLNIVDIVSGSLEDLLPTIFENLKNNRFVLIQAHCRRKNGELFPAEISVNRLNLSTQAYLSFFIRDITWRKAAEERLRTGHNAIQNSGSGIAVVNAALVLTYCNPALVTLLGLESAEELSERTIGEFLGNDPGSQEIRASLVTGGAWSGEVQLIRGDGSEVFALASVAPNLSPDQELMGMVISFVDISERRHAQQLLRARNAEMEEDLLLAREIQQTFLPSSYPTFPATADEADSTVRFSHIYHPSGLVGGDFFTVFQVSDTEAGVFISDVMGHGARAALVVATIRGMFERLASLADRPGEFLTHLNRGLVAVFRDRGNVTFVTAMYAVLDTRTGILRYACAGHPPPMLGQRDTGKASLLELTSETRGPALGLFRRTKYPTSTLPMAPRDFLVLYTDGLCEAENASRTSFDLPRMQELLQSKLQNPLEDTLKELVTTAQAFTGQTDFEDDVCALGVEFTRLSSE